MKKISIVLFALFIASCGGGGSGGSNDAEVEYGSDLNSDWDVEDLDCNGTVTGGTFTDDEENVILTIADGTMSPCVNATEDPTIESTSSKPNAFIIDTTDSTEQNVTLDSLYYTFNLNGNDGFDTTADNPVSITLPYDTALVSQYTPSFSVLVRLLNNENNSLVDLWGDWSDGYITVETLGLPNDFTAAVILSPGIDAIESDDVQTMISPSKSLTGSSWGASKWCVVYDQFTTELNDALTIKLGHAPADYAEIRNAVRMYVADAVAGAQVKFETAGFDAPNLYVSESMLDPCGTEFGYNNRYTIHLTKEDNFYQPDDSTESIYHPDNHYGRIYILYSSIGRSKSTSPYGSVYSAISHELLHAVQDSYLLMAENARGYAEGTATTYALTLDNDDVVTVRSGQAAETKLLSDFVSITKKGESAVYSYANQDFFAYVANRYSSLTFSYLPSLFESLYDYIEDAASNASSDSQAQNIRYNPPRNILFNGMDAAFQASFAGLTLKDIYLDFLRQRAFDHNEESQFGRSGETTTGFAADLFENGGTEATNSIATVSINASTCSITHPSGKFSGVAPYAARAIKIIPSTATTADTGPTISVTLTPSTGEIGDTWGGFSYRSGTSTELLSDSLEFTDFGRSTSDQIVIAVANTTNDSVTKLSFQVSCEGESGGEQPDDGGDDGGGGTTTGESTMSLTFVQEGSSLTPAWVSAGASLAIGYSTISVIVAESEISDESGWQYQNYLMVQMNTIDVTGPGTYSVDGCYADGGGVSLVYASTNPDNNSCAESGTITFTEYNTSAGGHMTGTMSVNTKTMLSPYVTGTVTATFDLVTGSSNGI